MKIVVLGLRGFPDIQGGVETHCQHLYTRMAAQGHDVVVICRRHYMTYAEASYHGVRLRRLACPHSRSLEAIVHTFVGVLWARLMNPDILHIHAVGPSLLVPLARALGMRVVSTNHGPDYDRLKWGGTARTILRWGESLGSRFSRGIIAISRPIAEAIERAYGRKAAVIPNGVTIRAPASETDALAAFGVEPGRYLLAVGRLVPEKGFHDLIDAFAKARLPGWKLLVVGRADHEDAYAIDLKKKAAAQANVVMPGFVSGNPLHQLYSHAGVFVLPSYHEGLPIALLEALSYGLPALASDIPANRQAGLADDSFFRAGDVDGMAQMLTTMTSRPMEAERRKRQVAFIAEHFNWDVITGSTIDFYRSLMGEKAARA